MFPILTTLVELCSDLAFTYAFSSEERRQSSRPVPRRRAGWGYQEPSTDEAGLLDSDSAAAPSLGNGVMEKFKRGARRQCHCAIAPWPSCWDCRGREKGRRGVFCVVFFWFCLVCVAPLPFYDTPSVFRYAVARGVCPSTAKVLLRHRWDGVLGRDFAGDNAFALSQGQSRGPFLRSSSLHDPLSRLWEWGLGELRERVWLAARLYSCLASSGAE
ncbi:hypothetical protein B0T25DRAFT_111080 [Lasiosphaeria hispida]|uniref:Transmembrane protein n=1 Tax=Lasiosphaeria hispida TaxID=260671 RepID=A0AAJ0HQY0_9PEZI|nr:hypothetical protein B0T25DRAFT_111080 [Lasiosphaeria hispida]